MATILEFRASREPLQPGPMRRPGRSAEIVIFPGVRYERWRDAPVSGETARQKTARDILELVD